jgi:hypothetical protein
MCDLLIRFNDGRRENLRNVSAAGYVDGKLLVLCDNGTETHGCIRIQIRLSREAILFP